MPSLSVQALTDYLTSLYRKSVHITAVTGHGAQKKATTSKSSGMVLPSSSSTTGKASRKGHTRNHVRIHLRARPLLGPGAVHGLPGRGAQGDCAVCRNPCALPGSGCISRDPKGIYASAEAIRTATVPGIHPPMSRRSGRTAPELNATHILDTINALLSV